MIALLTTLLPALIPALSDSLKAVVGKFTGGAKPLNIAEQVQLMEADTAKLIAISKLEGDGQTYQWVEAVRKLQRPFVVLVVMLVWAVAFAGLVELTAAALVMLADLSSAVMFYLFGERGYSMLKGIKK